MTSVHRWLMSLVVALSVVGCGGSAPPPPAEPGVPLHHPWRLYPLLADSAWAYDVDTGDGESVLAVTRVVEARGASIQVVTGSADRTLYELREDGIFRPALGGYLLQAPIQVGTTWPSGGDKVATVTSIDVVIEVPAGAFTQCVLVEERGSESGILVRTTYCPDAGPVEVESVMEVRGQQMRAVAKLRGFTVGAP